MTQEQFVKAAQLKSRLDELTEALEFLTGNSDAFLSFVVPKKVFIDFPQVCNIEVAGKSLRGIRPMLDAYRERIIDDINEEIARIGEEIARL